MILRIVPAVVPFEPLPPLVVQRPNFLTHCYLYATTP
jgi:hypothetical protein